MKNLLNVAIVMLLLAPLSTAFAQFQVDPSDLPVSGDVFSVAYTTQGTVNLGSPSPTPQVWDFTAVTSEGSDTMSFILPNQTPYGADFPTADMSQWRPFMNPPAFLYFSHQASGIVTEGINVDASFAGFGHISVPALDKELIFAAPANYGDSFQDAAAYETIIDAVVGDFIDTMFRRVTTKTIDFDGFGTLYTAQGDTFDVMRIREYNETYDTIVFLTLGNPTFALPVTADTTITYYFVADSIHYPVSTVRTNGLGSIEYVEWLESLSPPPNAEFFANKNNILTGESVDFTNLSAGATSWEWSFGDGMTSTDLEPSHTYSSPGMYTVALMVYNSGGGDTMTKMDYIGVYDAVTADFTPAATGLTVDFTNGSSNATTYDWTFGDGQVSSDEHPSHTYTSAGEFIVQLTSSNPASSDSHADTVSVMSVGIAPMINELGITLYPNPSNGIVYIDFNDPGTANWHVSLVTLSGQKIDQRKVAVSPSKHRVVYDLNGKAAGIYLLEVANEEGVVFARQKLVVQE